MVEWGVTDHRPVLAAHNKRTPVGMQAIANFISAGNWYGTVIGERRCTLVATYRTDYALLIILLNHAEIPFDKDQISFEISFISDGQFYSKAHQLCYAAEFAENCQLTYKNDLRIRDQQCLPYFVFNAKFANKERI